MPPIADDAQRVRAGFTATVFSYVMWGVSPLFFKTLAEVPAFEVVAHRVVWGLLAVGLFLALRGEMGKSLAVLRDRRTLLITVGAAVTIGVNWLVYVYAVVNGLALQASLGYFVLPLVSVLLGVIFLKERLTARQVTALLLVSAGVITMMVGVGTLPWVTLSLAFSFSIYGLLRKVSPSESLSGLFNETLLVMPIALGYLLWLEGQGKAVFGHGGRWDLWLLLAIGTPLWTALPLFTFAFGARRLKLSTVGLMFYINPTLQFLIAVFIFREPFTAAHALTFGLIWSGIVIYSWPRRRPAPSLPVAQEKQP